ncbi:MAG TPA: LytTR family DNA-binding domain-containing protein [Longimicrobiaceae bacterium]|nr:LytTR family DNA-binding domain-containing protein [Longimicrobiaceae bacterium]
MPIRSLVVDDEPLARRRVLRLLKAEPEAEVAGSAASGDEAVEAIRSLSPDLVFLDVQMPGTDGFGVLEALGPGEMPYVVFVTAYDQYALRAFEVHALDYLLKPFDAPRFHRAFGRARAQIRRRETREHRTRLISLLGDLAAGREAPDPAPGAAQPMDRLLVRSDGRILFLRAEEIDWIGAQGNYAELHVGADAYLIRETMGELEARLDPGRFLRVHRSTIVNLDRVRELRPWFGGDYRVMLHDGTELHLSRVYRARAAERLGTPL